MCVNALCPPYIGMGKVRGTYKGSWLHVICISIRVLGGGGGGGGEGLLHV